MKIHTSLIALLVMALVATPVMGKKLYRWVDKDGNVHYSDQVPPDEIDQARDELNTKGRVVQSVGVAASEAEIEALGEEEKRLQAERQRLLDEITADQKIEDSYANEAEIIRNRERKLAGLDLSIRNATNFIQVQDESVTSMEKRKAMVEADGGKVSDALQSMLDDLERQVTEQQAILESKTRERIEAVSFYDQELAGYRAMLKRKELREAAGN